MTSAQGAGGVADPGIGSSLPPGAWRGETVPVARARDVRGVSGAVRSADVRATGGGGKLSAQATICVTA
ncbi:MAG TPA: hypothetical protein VII48_13420, partial [Rhizomicrobium sp.]